MEALAAMPSPAAKAVVIKIFFFIGQVPPLLS